MAELVHLNRRNKSETIVLTRRIKGEYSVPLCGEAANGHFSHPSTESRDA